MRRFAPRRGEGGSLQPEVPFWGGGFATLYRGGIINPPKHSAPLLRSYAEAKEVPRGAVLLESLLTLPKNVDSAVHLDGAGRFSRKAVGVGVSRNEPDAGKRDDAHQKSRKCRHDCKIHSKYAVPSNSKICERVKTAHPKRIKKRLEPRGRGQQPTGVLCKTL